MVSYHSYIVQPALTEFRKTEYAELASHGCRLVSSSSCAALLPEGLGLSNALRYYYSLAEMTVVCIYSIYSLPTHLAPNS